MNDVKNLMLLMPIHGILLLAVIKILRPMSMGGALCLLVATSIAAVLVARRDAEFMHRRAFLLVSALSWAVCIFVHARFIWKIYA